MTRRLTLVFIAVLAICGAVFIRGLRRVPPPSREATRTPLTDMAPRRISFDPGPSPESTDPTVAGAAAETGTMRATASPPPPAVPPELMPDPVHPPQGTLPLAVPDPPNPPNPLEPPAMSVDPWAQRRSPPP